MKELNIKLCEQTGHCLITLDGVPVGLIQSIKVEVSVERPSPEVEIVFPDLRLHSGTLKENLLETLERFQDMPFVKIKFKELKAAEPLANDSVKEWISTELPEDPKDLKDPRDE